MSMTINGRQRLKVQLAEIPAEARTAVERALVIEADQIVADAKRFVRHDTYDLRDAIAAEVSGLSATVRPRSSLLKGSYVKAMVNEFGRANDPGKPYMNPAAEIARVRLPKRVAQAIKEALP